ncbi:MAG: hypothetical protein IPG99_02315 [Ignavibacteria bacterium]|nr:hypothetical protein [Ignavibacteria bacterium]
MHAKKFYTHVGLGLDGMILSVNWLKNAGKQSGTTSELDTFMLSTNITRKDILI